MSKKLSVEFSHSLNSTTIREFTSIQHLLPGATVVCGFSSGVSLTPALTAGYLVEQLCLPLIGVISSSQFPAKCIIEKGIPLPPLRLYGKGSTVVVTCEFALKEAQLIHDVVSLVLYFTQRHHASLVITTEGLPLQSFDRKKDGGKLKYIASQEKFAANMKEMGHEEITDGVISGVSGLLLTEGLWSHCDVGCIVAPTSSQYPDVNAAVDVVKVIKRILNLEIDTTVLEDKAKTIDISFAKLLKDEKSTTPSHMYG